MGLLEQLNAKRAAEEKAVEEAVSAEAEAEAKAEVVDTTVKKAAVAEDNATTESAEDKLRRRRNRELFEDEVKDGKWAEYQAAVAELKKFATEKKMNFLNMVSGVNVQYKKTTSAVSTYVRKQKEMNAAEKEFDQLKTKFDEAVSNAITQFQQSIDALAAKYNYKPEEGKAPKVQRTAFIEHGREFRDFLAEQK